ncbi:MAG: response regulator [Caldilineae bacterium]|nr:MAG: response regulator [Caldilineae bacterium]
MTHRGHGAKILYVDDDRMQCKLVAFVLTSHGFQVQTAVSGREGIELAVEWMPDVILMDLVMPGIDGFEATRILRADPRTRHIPVLALSGHVEYDTYAQAHHAGIDEIMEKGILPMEMVRTIRTYLPRGQKGG